MQIKILTRQYNKVAAHIDLENDASRDELQIGNIKIYFREECTEFQSWCFIMIVNTSNCIKGDIYACRISSEKLNLKNQRFICDESEWRLLVQFDKPYEIDCYDFDITLEAEIFLTRNPFAALYEDNELADFELIGDDGSVHFHSAVLAAASPALRRMLMGKWTETESRSLKIKDTSKATLQHLKDYLYMYKLPDSGVENLLVLASYYIMTDLENKCIDKLLCHVTTENSTELARFALNHNLMKLYYSFLELVKDGLIDVKSLRKKEIASQNEMDVA